MGLDLWKWLERRRFLCKVLFGGAAVVCFLTDAPGVCGVIDVVPVVPPGVVSLRDQVFDNAITRGVLLVFTDRHAEGIEIFDSLLKTCPENPAPYFFKAAAYQSWMSSLRTNRFEQELAQNIDEAIRKGNFMLRHKRDPWVSFYVGATYGYRALYGFRKHDWISAYLDAGKGVENFQQALEREPLLYDAYLGLGSYHYWRSAKSETLRLIAFWIPDKRELGLKQLRFAFEHGRYAVHEAGYNLVAAYYDAGQNREAMETLNRTIQGKNAVGLSDLYYKGRLLIRFEKWQEVERTFRDLLMCLQTQDIVSVGYQVECLYWIAVALVAQDRKTEAREVTERALKLGEDRDGYQELEGPFESFREISLKLFGLRYRLQKEKKVPMVTPP